jgi:probable phosphoglycerate mutase
MSSLAPRRWTRLATRVRAGINRIAAAHPDERVVVFTHGGVIGVAIALATQGRPFAFVGADNASITHLVVAGDRWILRRFNDTDHLDTDLNRRPSR